MTVRITIGGMELVGTPEQVRRLAEALVSNCPGWTVGHKLVSN